MRISTKGLIVKEQNIGEQDKLVTVLTENMGIIRAFVRGAKNIKSTKCAGTSLLSYSKLEIYKGRNSYVINDAKCIEIFIKLRDSIENMSLAQYFCELAITICPQDIDSENHLRIILNGLHLLANNNTNPLVIKPCVEMRLMSYSGYMPDLIMCKSCGAYESEELAFFPKTGTLLCGVCYNKNLGNSSMESNVFLKQEGIAILMDMSIATALRHTIYADENKVFSFTMPEEKLKTLNKITEAYLNYMLDKDFPTLKFYKSISNI